MKKRENNAVLGFLKRFFWIKEESNLIEMNVHIDRNTKLAYKILSYINGNGKHLQDDIRIADIKTIIEEFDGRSSVEFDGYDNHNGYLRGIKTK